VNANKPEFPVTVIWHEDGEQESFKNEVDAACTLEWFDSREGASDHTVVDNNGNAVVLVIEQLEVKLCHLV